MRIVSDCLRGAVAIGCGGSPQHWQHQGVVGISDESSATIQEGDGISCTHHHLRVNEARAWGSDEGVLKGETSITKSESGSRCKAVKRHSEIPVISPVAACGCGQVDGK